MHVWGGVRWEQVVWSDFGVRWVGLCGVSGGQGG